MGKVKKVTKQEALEDKTNESLMRYCAQNNSGSFNFNKAIEECTEFTEVLIKMQTKHPDNKNRPTPEMAVAEFGDVLMRGSIALLSIHPDLTFDEVIALYRKTMNAKFDKLKGWLKEDKYSNGL